MVISKNWNSGNISPRKSGILELIAAANQEVNNSKIPDLRELIIPEFQISRIPDLSDLALFQLGKSGILEFLKPGILEELASANLEFW